MPEEVLFKSENDQTREEIASYLRNVAEKLEEGDAITLKSGSESVTMEPPARPTFEVKAEREGPIDKLIDSRAIKRVLTASEGKRPHTQTVARVMNFLDELGKDAVQLKKRRGKKFVVVNPEAADRLANADVNATGAHHDRGDRGSGPTQADGVIPSG